MGNRKRVTSVKVTNSPLISPEVLICSNFGAKQSERNELRQIAEMKRKQTVFNDNIELNKVQSIKRNRLMKAAINRPERVTTKTVSFMGKREIAEKEAVIMGGNVKLIADKTGVHFSNKRIAQKDIAKEVSANLHGTQSAEFTFRDNVSGQVVGKTTIKTNKIW